MFSGREEVVIYYKDIISNYAESPAIILRRFLENEEGILSSFRYFATVRRATEILSSANFSTIKSSLIGALGFSFSIIFLIRYLIDAAEATALSPSCWTPTLKNAF